jgi:predicted CoA-substrate-specific enzyme activase
VILGCDIGTSFTKAVLIDQGSVAQRARVPTEASPDRAMERVLTRLREEAGVKEADLARIMVTGWGQSRLTHLHTSQNMLNCLARAAIAENRSCKTVLCLGALQNVILSVNDRARVMEYRVNDKCASGCGKFLEIMFEALEVKIEDSEEIARAADKKLTLSGQCAVFYESDVVSLINSGESVANITDAIFEAVTRTIGTLCKRIRPRDPIVVGGGLANNSRIIEGVERILGRPLQVFGGEPDSMAAVGAALSANGLR